MPVEWRMTEGGQRGEYHSNPEMLVLRPGGAMGLERTQEEEEGGLLCAQPGQRGGR